MAIVKFRYNSEVSFEKNEIMLGTMALFKFSIEKKIETFKDQIERCNGLVEVVINNDLSDLAIQYHDLPVELIDQINRALISFHPST